MTLELDENGRVNGVRFCAPSWALRTPGKTPPDADPRQRVCYAGRCGDHGLWLPPAPHATAGSGGVALDSQGRIKAGVESRYRYQTSQEKIFAGGDAVRGADLVVTAMAEGRHAAQDPGLSGAENDAASLTTNPAPQRSMRASFYAVGSVCHSIFTSLKIKSSLRTGSYYAT